MSSSNVMEAVKHLHLLIVELLFLRTLKYRTKAIITNNNFTRVPHACLQVLTIKYCILDCFGILVVCGCCEYILEIFETLCIIYEVSMFL